MPTKELSFYLKKVNLKGFKSIENLTVELENGLNVLIGKNLSGKSNFLEGLNSILVENQNYIFARIEFLFSNNDVYKVDEYKMFDKSNRNEKGIFENYFLFKHYLNNKIIFNNSSKYNIRLSKRQEKDAQKYTEIFFKYRFPIFIQFNLPNELEFISVAGSVGIPNKEIVIDWEIPNTLKFLKNLFQKIQFSGKLSSLIETKSISKKLFEKKLQISNKIKDNLRKYSPIQDVRFNKNINFYRDEKLITIENIKLDFKIDKRWVPWSHLSDGTRRLFYLIAEISDYNGGIVFVEEPELGVHPHQFHQIMEFLKEQSSEKQIIISTHSPQALNVLKEDELSHILITYYDEKKGTQIRHLTKPQINKAQKYMKEVGFLSDYWMLSDLES